MRMLLVAGRRLLGVMLLFLGILMTFTHREFGNLDANGVFVPSPFGSSVISSRRAFEPATGTFVPTLHGPFTLTTREAFNPITGTFTPSPTGPFVDRTRGIFVPAGFNAGFSSPWNSNFSAFQNPWLQSASRYAVNGNWWGTMNGLTKSLLVVSRSNHAGAAWFVYRELASSRE